MIWVTVAQVGLGLGALIVVGATEGIQPRPVIDVVLTTLHQVSGALLLGCAVMLTLWTRRLLVPGPEPHGEE